MGIYDRDYGHANYDGGQIRFAIPSLTPIVKRLLIINIAIFIPSYLVPGIGVALDKWFAVYPATIGMSLQVWRVLSYQFLHGGIGHILMNMLVLYFFGPMLERQWGSKKFLYFYLMCGAMGGLLYTFLVLAGILPAFPLVGASGAIYGMLAAGAILFPNLRVYVMGIFPLPLMVLAIIFASISVLQFLGGSNAGGEAAHLAGMGAGAVYVLWPRWKQKIFYRPKRRPSRKPVKWDSKINQQRQFQAEVDRILDKVHESGIASLTRKEKNTLKKASQQQRM